MYTLVIIVNFIAHDDDNDDDDDDDNNDNNASCQPRPGPQSRFFAMHPTPRYAPRARRSRR